MVTRIDLSTIANKLGEHSARDFFRYAREQYLGEDSLNQDLEVLLQNISDELRVPKNQLWGTQKFQLVFRATRSDHLRVLGLDEFVEEAEQAIQAGRVMSLLPYNAVMGDTTIRKFIPSHPDRFKGRSRHSMDPYGIFRGMDKVVTKDKDGNETYLATRKFPYAVLANITEACNVGCDGCYKGSMVRTGLSALAEVYPEYAEIKKQLSLQEDRAKQQAKLLTDWLNQNPEVDTIVISGGEPTLFSNRGISKILEQYKRAEHVKVVRMCTSSIFQGMWYRIDDEFVETLRAFEEETGKQFYVNAHVTDDYQLSAPEARFAIEKLERAGITIHLQTPLQEDINFRKDDLEWSVDKLRRISKLAYSLGVIPYKLIVDMHSPSDAEITVPIETVTKAISFLDQHEHHSDHERWQAYNILHEQGNTYLTPYPHFAAVKEINPENQIVTYFIPKVEFGKGKRIVVHTYSEPLITGHNDNPDSLSRITDQDILEKIDEVRSSYRQMLKRIAEVGTEECSQLEKRNLFAKLEADYYTKSGISYVTNTPLLIN